MPLPVLNVNLSLKSVVRVRDPMPPRPPPTIPPPCTKGPSFPAMSPDDIEKTIPTNFAINVFTCNRPRIWTPFKYVFNSGIPLPAANGYISL